VIAAALSYDGCPAIRTQPSAAVARRRFRSLVRDSQAERILVLHNASVQLNTFPSGHTATSTAAALASLPEALVQAHSSA
jgi:membrane-associated phospholipid phosphatase